MSVENPSLLYVEQTLTAEQKARACLNIGAQPTVAGKGLSSNDYTDAEKLKLSGMDADAEENTIESITVNGSAVQPDITKNVAITIANVPTVTSNDDGKVLKASYSGGVGSYDWDTAGGGGEVNVIEAITVNSESTTISNKTVNIPAATASTSGAGGNSGVMTPADKEKLNGLVSNVQSDWNAASGSAAEILNKPTIPSVDQTYSSSSTNAQSGVAVASAISDIFQVPSVDSGDDGKVLKASYSGGVGSYDWATAGGGGEVNVIEAITVNNESTTISNKTVNIPAATASTSGVGGMSGVMSPSDKEKLDGLVSNVQSDWNAASGTAAEILNKPTIPTVDQTYDGTSTNAQSGTAVALAISGIDEVPSVGSGDDGKVLKASYSGGAGSYSWDTDSGEANVIEAITVNGESTTISSKTVNIPAATASTSGVGGTSGVMTASDKEKLDGLVSNVQSDWNAASGTAAEILNKPTIPTVDQTYSSSSTNAQSGVAVASALSGLSFDEVPQVTDGDNGKVLKASYSGGAGSYSWQPESGGGGTTYAAGDGIAIDSSNNISVKIPSSSAGLEFNSGVLDVKTSTAKGIQKGASGLEVRLANSSGLELSSGLKVKTDGSTIQVNSSGELVANGGGGTTYTAGDGIDISAQNAISANVDGTSITVNSSHQLTTSAEANVIEGVKLDGAASVLTPDASKNVTIPNAVATGENGATNGLMTADDKKAIGTAVQYKVNPQESGTHVLLAQQIYVVESDAQIVAIANNASEINGKGTLFFRIGTAVT